MITVLSVVAMFVAGAAQAVGGTVYVGTFGDQGWFADDTRTSSGTNLVGTNYTHAGKPGQAATTSDDAQIANQIQFVNDAPGGVQAVKLSFGAGLGGKAHGVCLLRWSAADAKLSPP